MRLKIIRQRKELEMWQKAKNGEVKGFSIEGYFADKLSLEVSPEILDDQLVEQILNIIDDGKK